MGVSSPRHFARMGNVRFSRQWVVTARRKVVRVWGVYLAGIAIVRLTLLMLKDSAKEFGRHWMAVTTGAVR